MSADSFGLAPAGGPDVATLRDVAHERSVQILAEGEALAADLHLPVATRSEPGHDGAWAAILRVADEVDAEVIVVGTHGDTAVDDGLLGSVATALAHHTRRPLLLVPAHGG
jgi:nucleotide-binding universal stress UspA family protein